MLAQASIDKHRCQSVCWKSPRNNKSSPFLNQHLSSSWMPLTGKHDGLVPKARHQTASPINNSLPLTPACIQVYSPYIICFPGRMKQSISQPCMFYKSNKILALSTECGIFKSSIHGSAGVPRPGNSWKARRDQLAEKVRYQLLWPRQMSARQSDHLWPGGGEKNQRGYVQDL